MLSNCSGDFPATPVEPLMKGFVCVLCETLIDEVDDIENYWELMRTEARRLRVLSSLNKYSTRVSITYVSRFQVFSISWLSAVNKIFKLKKLT